MKKLLAGVTVAAAVALSAGSVSAANLSIGGGSNHTLSGFDLSGTTGLNNGDTVKLFDGNGEWPWNPQVPETNGGNGLQLTGAPATLRFTYLGSEAGDLNRAFYSGTDPATQIFDTSSGVNSYFDVVVGADGPVPFYFENEGGKTCFLWCWENPDEQANNEGGIDRHVSMAFFQENPGSVIALFGDGTGDLDMDDMALRVSVVPLPPAVLMFGAALLGLGWVKRRKQAA